MQSESPCYKISILNKTTKYQICISARFRLSSTCCRRSQSKRKWQRQCRQLAAFECSTFNASHNRRRVAERVGGLNPFKKIHLRGGAHKSKGEEGVGGNNVSCEQEGKSCVVVLMMMMMMTTTTTASAAGAATAAATKTTSSHHDCAAPQAVGAIPSAAVHSSSSIIIIIIRHHNHQHHHDYHHHHHHHHHQHHHNNNNNNNNNNNIINTTTTTTITCIYPPLPFSKSQVTSKCALVTMSS